MDNLPVSYKIKVNIIQCAILLINLNMFQYFTLAPVRPPCFQLSLPQNRFRKRLAIVKPTIY